MGWDVDELISQNGQLRPPSVSGIGRVPNQTLSLGTVQLPVDGPELGQLWSRWSER